MIIATVSDLHIDHPGNRPVIDAMIEQLSTSPPDVLVLAGDLASTPLKVADLLQRMAGLAPRVAFVPGNHDLWAPTPDAEAAGMDTWTMYRQILPEVCHRLGIHYLPGGPLVLGDVALVGSSGWYDFSLASRFARFWFRPEDFAAGRYGRYGWADMRRTCFRRPDGSRMPDAEVAAVMAGELETQLGQIGPEVRHIVGVTHVQPFREVVVSWAFPAWDYFTAFMGTALLGEAYRREPRVRVAVYGHTHTPGDKQVGSIRVVGTPLGYPRERREGASPAAVARNRINWIEV